MNAFVRIAMRLFVLTLAGCGAAPSAEPLREGVEESAPPRLEAIAGTATKKVTLLRTPDGGIQPQAVMDQGVLHLIYFKGEAKGGDAFYVKSHDDGKTFTRPLRVNSQPGSVIAAGNVRGAHLAIGAGGRAHVAWMGSMKAAAKGDHHSMPMLYTRLNEAGSAFEPQRNLIQIAYGLDGGGSIAAQGKHVSVAWHAPTPGTKGEENRRVWLTTSTDEGATFGKETPISPADSGSCGCCGMRVFSPASGQTLALYRGAKDTVHRPMYLLAGDAATGAFRSIKLHEWETGTCPMSTMAFAAAGDVTLAAWETEGQISYARVADGKPSAAVAAPGKAAKRRHPVLATNGTEILLGWTEGMGWNKGGALAWQVYDAKDTPSTNGPRGDYGRADGVPVWSLISGVAFKNGGFAIIY